MFRNETVTSWNNYGSGAIICATFESRQGSMTTESPTQILSKAFEHACKYHGAQVRKGTSIPYVSHLMQVAGLVLDAGGSTTAAVAALLHDSIEDSIEPSLVRSEIRAVFGQRVASIVDRLTDADVHPKPPWAARKRAYIKQLREETDPDVLLVSQADKLHNVRAIVSDLRTHGSAVWERFKGKRRGTIWYYSALRDTYEKNPGPLFADFAKAYAELEEAASLGTVPPDPVLKRFIVRGDPLELEVTPLGPGEFRIEDAFSAGLGFDELDLPEENLLGAVILGDEHSNGDNVFLDAVEDPTLQSITGFVLSAKMRESAGFERVCKLIMDEGGHWELTFGGLFSAYLPRKSEFDLRAEVQKSARVSNE